MNTYRKTGGWGVGLVTGKLPTPGRKSQVRGLAPARRGGRQARWENDAVRKVGGGELPPLRARVPLGAEVPGEGTRACPPWRAASAAKQRRGKQGRPCR